MNIYLPIPCWKHKGYFQFLSHCKQQCYTNTLVTLGHRSKSFSNEKLLSLGMHILSFIICSQIALRSDCTNLHSHQQGLRVQFSHVFTNSWCWQIPEMPVKLFHVKWCFTLVLICISFITSEDNHPFICSLTLLNSLLTSFAHF